MALEFQVAIFRFFFPNSSLSKHARVKQFCWFAAQYTLFPPNGKQISLIRVTYKEETFSIPGSLTER